MFYPTRDKFPSLLENVVLGSLESFFQLDHQMDINLYLMEATALCHSRELASLKPSWCTFNPISLFGFPDFKLKIHFIVINTWANTLG